MFTNPYLIAFLDLHGVCCRISSGPDHRVHFEVPSDEETQLLVSAFFANELVPVLHFIKSSRKVRRLMRQANETEAERQGRTGSGPDREVAPQRVGGRST